jgi:hypothetical protein
MANSNADYLHLVTGGQRTIVLTPDEEATILRLYDYGLGVMTEREQYHVNVILAKLKDQIHP